MCCVDLDIIDQMLVGAFLVHIYVVLAKDGSDVLVKRNRLTDMSLPAK